MSINLAPREGYFDGPEGLLGLMNIVAFDGVYQPIADSELLMEAFAEDAAERAPGTVLDLCCGTGVQAVTAALLGGDVVAVDIDRAAVDNTRENARLNRVIVDARCGDLFEPVAGLCFDSILSNPPYVPAPPEPTEHGNIACDAGDDGRELVDAIIDGAPHHLVPGGVLWMVQSSLTGIDETVAALEKRGLSVEIAAERREPLGPVSTERFDYLCRRGVIAPHETHERLVVIRAVRPDQIGSARARLKLRQQPRRTP